MSNPDAENEERKAIKEMARAMAEADSRNPDMKSHEPQSRWIWEEYVKEARRQLWAHQAMTRWEQKLLGGQK